MESVRHENLVARVSRKMGANTQVKVAHTCNWQLRDVKGAGLRERVVEESSRRSGRVVGCEQDTSGVASRFDQKKACCSSKLGAKRMHMRALACDDEGECTRCFTLML